MIREYCDLDQKAVINLGNLLHNNYAIDNKYDFDKFVVYEDNGTVKAFMEFRVLYGVIELLNIIVHPDYRREGIGTKLMNYLLTIEHESIILEVSKLNIEAINLYKKNGFYEIREIKKYYNDSDALVMERKNI